jgi:hypothetical protein
LTTPLQVESVCDESNGSAIIREIAAGGNCWDFWEPMAHNFEKFDSRHTGHMKIADNQVRGLQFELFKRIETVLRRRYYIALCG